MRTGSNVRAEHWSVAAATVFFFLLPLLAALLVAWTAAVMFAEPAAPPAQGGRTPLYYEAAADLAGRGAAAIPRDLGGIRVVGVLEIEGDDGTLRSALTSAVLSQTPLKVVERERMDLVVDQLGDALGLLLDPEARVRLGRMLDAQAVLFGSVLERSDGRLSAALRARLKLVDLELGEVRMEGVFSADAVSPHRQRLILALAVFLAACVCLVLFRSTWRARLSARFAGALEAGEEARAGAGAEVGKALKTLADVRDELFRAGRKEDALAARQSESDLRLLQSRLRAAPAGLPGSGNVGRLAASAGTDRDIHDRLKALPLLAEDVLDAARSGDADTFRHRNETLRSELRQCTNMLEDRAVR